MVRTHRATLADRGLNGGADEEPKAADFLRSHPSAMCSLRPFRVFHSIAAKPFRCAPATLKKGQPAEASSHPGKITKHRG